MSNSDPQPIPTNRSTTPEHHQEDLELLRYRELTRPSSYSGGDNPIVWIILAPFLLLGLFILLALIVAAGAGVETAVSGG